MKAIIYTRISTPNQKNGKGLKLQLKACQLEVVQLSQKIDDVIEKIIVFQDIISGTSKISERLGLCDALGSLNENDLFVVYDLSRLARKSVILYKIIEMISKSKAKLIVVRQNEIEDENRIASLIADERKVIVSKNSALKKVKEKQRRKERIGNIPFGYCMAKNGVHIKKDKKEQRIIKKIECDRSKGKSFREITQELNAKGYRNRKENLFTSNQVYKINKVKIPKPILRNPTYGFKIVNKEYETNYYEQQIIDLVKECSKHGWSYRKITEKLNNLGFKNRKNNKIHLTQVSRIIKRLNFQ